MNDVQCFDGDGRDPDETGAWDAHDFYDIHQSNPQRQINAGYVYAPYQPVHFTKTMAVVTTRPRLQWVYDRLPACLRFQWLRRMLITVDVGDMQAPIDPKLMLRYAAKPVDPSLYSKQNLP